ncbi:Yip1 family protein [Paenibacillus pinihumi]|uniref:Yip1 family protein n=1 Tax=Paenibacillus pinihumi TaxID=669462 RepID=UPI00048CE377|nr:Yip1 family protein [Paenibacillus pinihumi]
MLREMTKYPFYVLLHPFQGFWDLKYENKGRLRVSLAILLLLAIATIVLRQYAGFVVNFNFPYDLNSINELQYIVLPFFLWCVANWSLTTLMDGEGKFKEIVMATGYALLPLVLMRFGNTLISNVITVREAAFYYLFDILSILWFVWLLFIGTMTVHQYTVLKTIMTMLLTLFVMGIIMFLGLLFFSLLQEMLGFVLAIYTEISLRI